jgi:hypothetical protein
MRESVVEVLQSAGFRVAYKKLHLNQKADVDSAVAAIMRKPDSGEAKKGELAGVYIRKYLCAGKQYLLAYGYDHATRFVLLLGFHENLCLKLKK